MSKYKLETTLCFRNNSGEEILEETVFGNNVKELLTETKKYATKHKAPENFYVFCSTDIFYGSINRYLDKFYTLGA